MARPPTAVQRRIIQAADPVTGRIQGTAAQLTGLVRLRLAFRHPRPPHDYFLTAAGHRLREQPETPDRADEPTPVPEQKPGVFAARLGGEEAPEGGGQARIHEVRSAWQGLIEMRRITNPDGSTDRPCGWERAHLVPAAALALEAAGCRPATPDGEGYRVTSTPQPEAVGVRHPAPEGRRACAAALEQAGWQVGEYTEPRTGARYLLASPRRA
ncbi:hypothetical protein [Streptomyces himalayensis]|uniref:Uncharacterized protein n=1 Tax=Streptomyces himalayensis subsp. himalayensis TaxID=2756131 RepID=A0A7W0DTU2_9ACTN|nr:hypothetical protein [Streptomyces himalayensis]MBA2951161.1 hypothetical protein [Streptomyces himalayensis subsp. himalayensis]